MDIYTFTTSSTRKILGDAATVFAVCGRHEPDGSKGRDEIPVLSLTGDSDFPIEKQKIAEGLATVLNGAVSPKMAFNWTGRHVGWVRHGDGLRIFVQSGEAHDSKKNLFALVSGGCPKDIAETVLRTLTDDANIKSFFDSFARTPDSHPRAEKAPNARI